MHQTLQSDKFEGADFKVAAQYTKNKEFLITNLRIFVFAQKFAIRQVRGTWFQIWQNHFQISARKYVNKALLVTDWENFILTQNFAIRQIRGGWLQTWQHISKSLATDTHINHF